MSLSTRLLSLGAGLFLVACTSNTLVSEPTQSSRVPSSAAEFRFTDEMLKQDFDFLTSSGWARETDLKKVKVVLQEIVTEMTAEAKNPNVPSKLKDASFVAAYMKPVEELGQNIFIGVVHFLSGNTEVRYLEETKQGNKKYLSIGVGFSFILDKRISADGQARIFNAIKDLVPEFKGSFLVGRVLTTSQQLSPSELAKIRVLLTKGMPGMGSKLETFEVLTARYNLPGFATMLKIDSSVDDLRDVMKHYQSFKALGITYLGEPKGIRPLP